MDKYKKTYIKDKISDTTIELLKSHDYNDITITEIIKTSGVSRASFYRHFRNIKDVIEYSSYCLNKEFFSKYNYDNVYTNLTSDIIEFLNEHKNFYLTLYEHSLLNYALKHMLDYLGTNKELNSTIAYSKSIFCFAIYGIICEYINRGMKETKEEVQEKVNYLVNEFVNSKSKK